MKVSTNRNSELHVVAVGASAGGLEAIHEFFDHIPDSTNLSFIIIQHLSSDYKSLLVELVSKHTHMKVQEAKHQVQVQAGCVYVIPNDKLLKITNGKLVLSEKETERGPNLAIDAFLYSLAEDQKEKAIAVILSGTGTDGTKGAEKVKANNGLVMVQDPSTAKFDGMPKSAIAANVADYILPPTAMAEEIYNYIDGYTAGDDSPARLEDAATVNRVLELVHKQTGFDFLQYKQATIDRRITRRMLQTKQKELAGYEQLLKEDTKESELLAKEFFIGVTSFFRDKEAYTVLYSEVFPGLIAAANIEGEAIKIWVTACSTGQEAYSIAILLDKFLQQQDKAIDVKIFASDIDKSAIEFASRGVYPLSAVGNMEDDLLSAYFIRSANDYTVIQRIRKQIVFARHNILKDPPFIKNDLVTCRNLLIYLNNNLQSQVLSAINFSLKKGGYLFLGPSENLGVIKDDMGEVNNKWKIYRKHTDTLNFTRPVSVASNPFQKNSESPYALPHKVTIATQLAEDFKKTLSEDFGFAAVYINNSYEVKEVVGDFRRYLTLPDRIINLNILRMVPVELSGILSTAFRKVLKENKKTIIKNVRASLNGHERIFNILVQPPKATLTHSYLMVMFSEVLDNVRQPTPVTEVALLNGSNYVQELEEELKETRHNLQMAIEGLETTNEELQSSNEELQSANEELQSSNEELQSLNEELHTLNTEHQLKIKELVELNDDLNNYFRSTEIGQLLLDSRMHIRKFNPAAMQMINLIESDIGRPIDNISTNIRFADLVSDVKQVMQSNNVVEKEVELNNGTFCLMRILPYIRQDKKMDGVVITFIDVSIVKNLNNIVKGVFDTSLNALLVFKAKRDANHRIIDFTCTTANHAAEAIFKAKPEKLIDKSIRQFYDLIQDGFFERYVSVVEQNRTLTTELAVDDEGHMDWFDVVANKLQDGIILTLTSITHKKEAEEKLRKNYNELLRTKESLKQLNTQLEVKVQARTKDLAQSEERFRLVASATNDAIWDWNFVNNEMWWSDSFYNLFSYDRNDRNTKTASFWFDAIHPEDRDRVRNSINNVIHSDNGKWSDEYRFKKGDGSYAFVFDRASIMYDEFGTPYRMLGSMMDVTELQQTEEQLKIKNDELEKVIQEFKFVTDFMPQMVWSARADGSHDFFNKQWYDYTGIDFEQSKDKGWSLVLYPEDYERTLKAWQESLQTGKAYEIEYRLRRYDGVYRWFLARAIPLKDLKNNIIKWFGTCTDVHDQKLMTDVLEQRVKERTHELLQTNTELEASNNELLQFASVASHDLKEPLRKIHMFSHIIKDRYIKENKDAGSYLERIITSSSRMTRLINDLLTYSRLSVNSLFEPVNLNVIIKEVLSDLELMIQEKEAIIKLDDLPVIDAVPGQMRQVFQNLIFNALKFSREGVKPEITIIAEMIPAASIGDASTGDGRFCSIQIRDNGIGFDAQYRHKIFTIFQQLHSRDKYEGTGIGLAITKKIIEKHHGTITADSEVNVGTVFKIVLPLKQA